MSSEDQQKLQQFTDTNMLCSMIANTEKLIPKPDIKHYDDLIGNHDEDKIESCMEEDDNQEANNNVIDNKVDEQPIEQNNVQSEQQVDPPTQPINNEEDDEFKEYDQATPTRKKLLKLDMLRKLSELVKSGSKLSQHYDMDSDYRTMKFEYELQKTMREKHNTVKFFQDGCISAVGALEKANKRYDPFGFELDGWCDNVNNQSDRLYDTFGDLYEKWNKPGKSMPPEIVLVGILGFSAAKTHFVNVSTNSVQSIEEKQKNDPEYINKIRQQAMGNTIDMISKGKQDVFTEKLSKQYKNAVEQVKDYQKIREMEEAKLREQQVMKAPSLPQSLLRNQIQPQPHLQSRTNINAPSELTPEQFKQIREQSVSLQRQKMEQDLQKQMNHISRADMESNSNESIVQTDENIDAIIKQAETLSNASINKKRKNGKKKNSIKLNI